MRLTTPFRLLIGVCGLAAAAVAIAGAGRAARPAGDGAPRIATLRSLVVQYRAVTWTWERAAHTRALPTSYSERRSTDRAYLEWTVDRWMRRAWRARAAAVRRLERRFAVELPGAPGLRAPVSARLSYSRALALRLRRIYPGSVPRRYVRSRPAGPSAALRLWQERSAVAALQVALHAVTRPAVPSWLQRAFLCIHGFEGAWDANTGNGYYGGLQMDAGFMSRYGASYLRRWGTADNWPVWAQIAAAAAAYRSGRGFSPWPNTAQACGLP